MGLWQACLRHQENTNNTFWTFAYLRVKGAIVDFLRRERLLLRGDRNGYDQVIVFVPLILDSECGGNPLIFENGGDGDMFLEFHLTQSSTDKSNDDISMLEHRIDVGTLMDKSNMQEQQQRVLSEYLYEGKTMREIAKESNLRLEVACQMINNGTESLRREYLR